MTHRMQSQNVFLCTDRLFFRFDVFVKVTPQQELPYQHDSTASRLLSAGKHVRAQLVVYYGGEPRWNPGCCSLSVVPPVATAGRNESKTGLIENRALFAGW
jgi:hypothetical protein